MTTIRFVTFAIFWAVMMITGIWAAFSSSDWAERFAARCGDEPDAGGRAVRFFVLCCGIFIAPMFHIAIWEFMTRIRK
jgi:hypothetical protein